MNNVHTTGCFNRTEDLFMRFILVFTSSVLAAAMLLSVLPVYGESEIYSDVLRLHVIAESDGCEDQALKLKVRDAVLTCVSQKVADCTSFEEAYSVVEEMRQEILVAAQTCVIQNGSDCKVSLKLGKERYPRRDYGNAVLPAGVYPSLQVILGEGKGKNWWCVLFPTACVQFAKAEQDVYIAAGFSPEEYRMITGSEGKLKVRFRVLEILSELFA